MSVISEVDGSTDELLFGVANTASNRWSPWQVGTRRGALSTSAGPSATVDQCLVPIVAASRGVKQAGEAPAQSMARREAHRLERESAVRGVALAMGVAGSTRETRPLLRGFGPLSAWLSGLAL